MRDKPPVIEGMVPRETERHNLDKQEERRILQVEFREFDPVAAEYLHYPHCKWVVIEYEGSHLSNSVEQVESTTKKLVAANKPVDSAVIITKRLDDRERELYQKRNNVLYLRRTTSPIQISTGNKSIAVEVYYPQEIEQQYRNRDRGLAKWQY